MPFHLAARHRYVLYIQKFSRGVYLNPTVICLLTVPRQCCCFFFVIYVSCLSMSCFLVCSLQPCGHLLGKGKPLGSLVCDVLLYFVTFPCGVLGLVWYLIVSIPDLCLLTYYVMLSCLFLAAWERADLLALCVLCCIVFLSLVYMVSLVRCGI